MATRPLNGLALCAGIGGLELGLHLALGELYRTVCYVEREAYAASVLVARMEDKALDEAPVWDDIATFDGQPWHGLVDCVAAGYPCQPFSVAGARLGQKDPRHLWPEVIRIISECEPTYVFCENVDRHLSAGFNIVAAGLQSLGYVIAAGLFTAAEVGAPHRRRRLFFLAQSNRKRLEGRGGECGLREGGEQVEIGGGGGDDLNWEELAVAAGKGLREGFSQCEGNQGETEPSGQPIFPPPTR